MIGALFMRGESFSRKAFLPARKKHQYIFDFDRKTCYNIFNINIYLRL